MSTCNADEKEEFMIEANYEAVNKNVRAIACFSRKTIFKLPGMVRGGAMVLFHSDLSNDHV